MILSQKVIKIGAIWLLINTVITLLVLSFIAGTKPNPLCELFIAIFIISNMVSIFCNISGHFLGKLLSNKPFSVYLSVILFGSIFAASIAMLISDYLIILLFNYEIYRFFIPTLLIALIVTTITVITGRLNLLKNELKKDLDEIKLEKEVNSEKYSLSVREDDKYHMVNLDDLIYLSAHGKKTTLHTCAKDYETNQLMKNLENKLSDHFIRIHRQFIINTKYLSQVKYYEGGRYMAYLNDEDESALPVGRKVAPILKEKLGI